MPDQTGFEGQLSQLFERYADLAPVAVDRSIGERAISAGSRGGRVGLRWPVLGRRAYLWLAFALLVVATVAAAILAQLLTSHDRLPGRFIQTGPSQIAYATATAALPDGRVLVIGPDSIWRDQPVAPPNLVELYDAATNTFTAGPALPEQRQQFTLTALADGRVLLAGGSVIEPGGWRPSSSAELFDPASGQFQPTGSMTAGRADHRAVLLNDGRVLVAGGNSASDNELTANYSAEIYDPISGTWSVAGDLPGVSLYGLALLADGRVMFAGGWTGSGADVSTVSIYDPATREVSPGGELVSPRTSPGLGLLPDGRVLVVGGSMENTTLSSVELYDPATGKSARAGSLTTPRWGPAVVSLADGRVLVAGGSNRLGEPLSTEIYDPATQQFVVGASATYGHGASTVLGDGRIFFIGLHNELFDPSLTTDIIPLAPRTDRVFVAGPEPLTDRHDHLAVKVPDGRVLIVGGVDRSSPEGDYAGTAEMYEPATDSFERTGSPLGELAPAVSGDGVNAAVAMQDGRVVLVGRNFHFSGPTTWSFQAFDPQLGRFDSLGQPIVAENGLLDRPRLVAMSTGDLIVVGPPLTESDLPTAQVYRLTVPNPTLTLLAALPDCRQALQAELTADDHLVVLCQAEDGTRSVVTFDPATGASVRTGMWIGDQASALLVLADGRLLVATGLADNSLLLFDPASGALVPAGNAPSTPMTSFRDEADLSMTLLADGRVLLISHSQASLWDPATSTARSIPGPLASLQGHSASRLNDGRVLLVGGSVRPADFGLPTPPATELFDPAELP